LETVADHLGAHARRRLTNKKEVTEFIGYLFFVERPKRAYLVFSVVSGFFSSIFSVDFALDFLVCLVLALAFGFVLAAPSVVELDFSVAVSLFFSVAGGVAGLAGVAGVAWAKLTALNTKVVSTRTKALIAFFTVSPPFGSLDAGLLLVFK
jgi:hypothetical protein